MRATIHDNKHGGARRRHNRAKQNPSKYTVAQNRREKIVEEGERERNGEHETSREITKGKGGSLKLHMVLLVVAVARRHP